MLARGWVSLGAVQITSALFILLLLGVFGGLFFLLNPNAASQMENIMVNAVLGGEIDFQAGGGFLFGFLLLVFVVFVVGALGQIAMWLVVRHKSKEIENPNEQSSINPFRTFFVDSWSWLAGYVRLMLRLFWYVFIRLLLVGLVFALLMAGASAVLPQSAIQPVGFVLGMVALFFVFWVIAQVLLSQPLFFMLPDKPSAQIIAHSIAILQKNKWKRFALVLLPVFVLGAISQLFGFFSQSAGNEKLFIASMALYQLVSFFVLTPLLVGYLWRFARLGLTELQNSDKKDLPE